MELKKRVVGVVGLGHVGAHVAFVLGMMGIADEVKSATATPRRLKANGRI
mgnify:CR=1 FL=1